MTYVAFNMIMAVLSLLGGIAILALGLDHRYLVVLIVAAALFVYKANWHRKNPDLKRE